MANKTKAGKPINLKSERIISKAESLYINEGFIGASQRQTRYTLAEYLKQMKDNGQTVELPSWLKED